MNMKFVKGMMLGTIVTVGMAALYSESKNMGIGMSKKKMIRKGKQLAKKMGML